MKHFAMCEKCASRQTKPDPASAVKGVVPQVLVGCADMTPEEWEAGWRPNEDGAWRQRSCPIMRIMRVENEEPA